MQRSLNYRILTSFVLLQPALLCARLCFATSTPLAHLMRVREGAEHTMQYKLYFHAGAEEKDAKRISLWSDIPLHARKDSAVLNVCIEIPQNRLAKFEMSKKDPYHPIVQDVRKNKFDASKTELRYYAQFPLFNYGFFPQTWENDLEHTPEGFMGDGDPVDVCDLSDKEALSGDVYPVRVLGCFCLIDQGEVDWKVLTISEEEGKAKNITDIKSFEAAQPGRIDAIKNWFRFIKTYDGKKANDIYYDGEVFGVQKALEVVEEMHTQFQNLVNSVESDGELYKKAISYHLKA